MKTTMKQLAAGTILGLLLIVTNVHAEGKEALKATTSLEAIGTTLELESWMIDDNIWKGKSTFIVENETEETLILEDWMISDENWSIAENINIEIENDINLKLESWMTDSMVWNR